MYAASIEGSARLGPTPRNLLSTRLSLSLSLSRNASVWSRGELYALDWRPQASLLRKDPTFSELMDRVRRRAVHAGAGAGPSHRAGPMGLLG